MPTKILAFAGSTRSQSFNKRIVAVAAEAAREGGAEVEILDLADYRMPLFDEDEEAANGKSDAAKVVKAKMIASDGFLISSPEYNGSFTGVLKNTLDWVSRADEGDAPGSLPAFAGKAVTLMAASPGGLGGLRALFHVRDVLSGVGCLVLPKQVAVPAVHTQFGEDGVMKAEGFRPHIEALGRGLAEYLASRP